jgi:hypothetical protein
VDAADALQSALDYAAVSGDAVFLKGTYLISHSLTLSGMASLKGPADETAATLLLAPGSSFDAVKIGFQRAQTNFVHVENLRIKGQNPTGGYAIHTRLTADTQVRNVNIDHTFCGINDDQSNTNRYEQVWGYTVGTNCQIFYWHATSGRSDQLILRDVMLNADFHGNDGFVWDGFANTLDVINVVFLETNHGFWVRNTSASSTGFPQFADIYDLQVEGAQTAACQIDAGRSLYFTDSWCHSQYGETGIGGNQGNNDTASLVINPDARASVTANINFNGGSIGVSAKQAALLNAQQVRFNGTLFRSSSLLTANAYPSVELTSTPGVLSEDYTFNDVKFCGVYGDPLQNSFGLVRDANVTLVKVIGSSFHYCQSGEIADFASGPYLVVSGSVDRLNNPLPTSYGGYISNSVPTLSSCGNATVEGTASSGTIHTGKTATNTCTLNWGDQHLTPVCIAAPTNTAFTVATTATTSTSVTFQFSANIALTDVKYQCKQK